MEAEAQTRVIFRAWKTQLVELSCVCGNSALVAQKHSTPPPKTHCAGAVDTESEFQYLCCQCANLSVELQRDGFGESEASDSVSAFAMFAASLDTLHRTGQPLPSVDERLDVLRSILTPPHEQRSAGQGSGVPDSSETMD